MSLHLSIDLAVSTIALVALWVGYVPCEGEGGGQLVLKPVPSPRFWYETGQEGSWERDHPARARPWYLCGRYVTLAVDGECVGAVWPAVVQLGVLLFWLTYSGWAVVHAVNRIRES